MGVELTLTDRELPASPAFINFIAQCIDGRPFADREWPDQRSEKLNFSRPVLHEQAIADAPRVIADARGRQIIARAYQLLMALVTGDLAVLDAVQKRVHFIGVVGIPRSGGSYLTGELYRSLGFAPHAVPAAVAHDGFPEAGPFEFRPGGNSWIRSLHTVAEYLAMVEQFFHIDGSADARVVVPKKLTKAAYCGGFFHRILGDDSEYLLTLRHPVAACISTYEKSGGLPEGGLFRVRSNIEEWCLRDLSTIGLSAERVLAMDYFDAYLRYWEHYHMLLATSGLTAGGKCRVLLYGDQVLEGCASEFHGRHGSGLRPERFFAAKGSARRHPDWIERAEPTLNRVAQSWERAGLDFPLHGLRDPL